MREELVTVCVGARVVHFEILVMARISKCSLHGTHCHLIVAPSLLTVRVFTKVARQFRRDLRP